MKQNEKDQSLAGYRSGRSERDKGSAFPRGFVVSKMKKTTIKPRNQTLETLVTGDAKRQAESLGIPLAAFIGNLAAKADTLPVTIRVGMGDIGRINSLIGGGRVHEWIEGVVSDVLNGDGEELAEMAAKGGAR